MRISDWSSDVCSSDLIHGLASDNGDEPGAFRNEPLGPVGEDGAQALEQGRFIAQKETGRHFLRIEQETIVLRIPAISLALVAGAKAGPGEQIDKFGRRTTGERRAGKEGVSTLRPRGS